MRYERLDKVDGVVSNRYEAVIIAAKRARQINADRLAKLELMPENEDIDLDPRKVTTRAIEELIKGKIKFER
jgi:DNA-directed RNA polymerase omega subunit